MNILGRLNEMIIALHDMSRSSDNPAIARILRECAHYLTTVEKALRRIGMGHDV
jgi:hypothetical protein